MSVLIPCLCPPNGEGEARHPDGDTVELRDTLSFVQATTARNAVLILRENDPEVSVAEILANLTENYVIQGVTGWSVLDAKGKPLDCTRANLRAVLLANDEAATIVGDAADALYAEKVMLPLLKGASTSSKATPRDGSTSRTTAPSGSGKAPTPLKRSSTGSTRTAATERTTTSPGGDSSYSPSSASVA